MLRKHIGSKAVLRRSESEPHGIHGTGIFTYIYHKDQPKVGKYTIHGSYGDWHRNEIVEYSLASRIIHIILSFVGKPHKPSSETITGNGDAGTTQNIQ